VSEPAKTKAQLDEEFAELYRTHMRDLYSYAYYRIGNHHDAEDLVEQTFLQAYRHFERAQRESDGRPLRPWLLRIAHNLAANHYRYRSRRPQTSLEESEPVPRSTRRRISSAVATSSRACLRASSSCPMIGARR
jgi:RNA polymerase sigma-70 factor (ECF subfamily)